MSKKSALRTAVAPASLLDVLVYNGYFLFAALYWDWIPLEIIIFFLLEVAFGFIAVSFEALGVAVLFSWLTRNEESRLDSFVGKIVGSVGSLLLVSFILPFYYAFAPQISYFSFLLWLPPLFVMRAAGTIPESGNLQDYGIDMMAMGESVIYLLIFAVVWAIYRSFRFPRDRSFPVLMMGIGIRPMARTWAIALMLLPALCLAAFYPDRIVFITTLFISKLAGDCMLWAAGRVVESVNK